MQIDIDLLKKLREETQAPLKDCKEALIASAGNLNAAKDFLRQKGALTAAKKQDRATNEGIINIKYLNNKTVGIKLGCETDFVAKNDKFINLVDTLLNEFSKFNQEISNIDQYNELTGNENINNLINENIGQIGENIRLIDLFVKFQKGHIYLHPGNKLATVLYYEYNNSADTNNIAKELSLQIAALNPKYYSIANIPSGELETYKSEIKKELTDTHKPSNILEQIIEGKLQKIYSEIVLLEQKYIRDDTKKVKDIINKDFKFIGYTRLSF